MKKNKGGINMKFGKKAFGLIAATMALGIGTTQVFAATLTAEQAKKHCISICTGRKRTLSNRTRLE